MTETILLTDILTVTEAHALAATIQPERDRKTPSRETIKANIAAGILPTIKRTPSLTLLSRPVFLAWLDKYPRKPGRHPAHKEI